MSIKFQKYKYDKSLFHFIFVFVLLFCFFQDTNVIVEQSGTTAERFPVFAECLNLQSKGLENVLQPGSRLQIFKFQNL
jgi:hypothetical protein